MNLTTRSEVSSSLAAPDVRILATVSTISTSDTGK
jgi:hypothetical protein